jgi:hypothetical protein
LRWLAALKPSDVSARCQEEHAPSSSKPANMGITFARCTATIDYRKTAADFMMMSENGEHPGPIALMMWLCGSNLKPATGP